MTSNDETIIMPIPALVAVLLNKERDKGSSLTEDEVLSIRDGCACTAVTPEQAQRVVERRGYDDIDPENVWADWQEARKMFEDLDHTQ